MYRQLLALVAQTTVSSGDIETAVSNDGTDITVSSSDAVTSVSTNGIKTAVSTADAESCEYGQCRQYLCRTVSTCDVGTVVNIGCN